MRYGFKARAERLSAAARQELEVGPLAPLDCHQYVAHVGAIMLDFGELDLPAASALQLLELDSDSWSGMTIKEGNTIAILVNPIHTIERQRNTIMHEVSHLVLEHVPTRVDIGPGGILLNSEYAAEDEGEADWLAAAMLLPRDALMSCRARAMTNAQIATYYGVSNQLCDWRIRMTGINVQRRRAGGF